MITTPARVIIIGLDGGTFDLLTPLMDSQVMPFLRSFYAESAHGTLHSTNPPTTPPAWTTCTTGLNPGRHGIFDFTVSPLADPTRPLVSTRSAAGCRLWRWLTARNHRSVFVNVPITYPPESIAGCMISGMMTPGYDSPFTHPPELKTRLKAVCGNYICNIDIPRYDTACEDDARHFILDVAECTERRREAVRHLMDTENWTVFMAVFVGMDRILHLFAKYLFPGNPLYDTAPARRLRPLLLDEFRRLDSIIAEMVGHAHPGDMTMILSDHGFGTTDGFFNANTWLKSLGLLAVKPAPYLRARLFHTAHRIGDHPLIRSVIPAAAQSSIRHHIRHTRSTLHSARNDLEQIIDWTRTQAFFGSIPTQGIYINEKTPDNHRGIVASADVEPLRLVITDALRRLTLPGSDVPMTDAVWNREDVFHGDRTRFAPHLLFRMRNYAVLGRQHLGAPGYFSSAARVPIGFHRSNGIVMIRHPDIMPQAIEAAMADVMPTVLYAAGVPIPDNLDGHALVQLFSYSFRRTHPAAYEPVPDSLDTGSMLDPGPASCPDADRITLETRLKHLGYLE
ncbi:alkaline phosphatase family protein [bacterium]|nr:alkaline phosphatase family protein [candidate division CSSED10-310 bacterium]